MRYLITTTHTPVKTPQDDLIQTGISAITTAIVAGVSTIGIVLTAIKKRRMK